MRGEYDPSDSLDEPFRNPSEIPKIVKAIPGFEESVRDCMSFSHVLLHIFNLPLFVSSCLSKFFLDKTGVSVCDSLICSK